MISSYQRGGTAISQSISASGHWKDGGREESGEASKERQQDPVVVHQRGQMNDCFQKDFFVVVFSPLALKY